MSVNTIRSSLFLRSARVPLLIRSARLNETFGCTNSCWNCKIKHECEIFCPSCHLIQCTKCASKPLNYFEMLCIKETFDVSVATIKRYYIGLQAKLHPDKFVQRSDREQRYSLVQSAVVNEALVTLSDPLKRGLYLLEINGHAVTDHSASADQSFLMDMFERNFEIQESDDVIELKAILEEIAREIEQDVRAAGEAFSRLDFEAAKQVLMGMKYRVNLRDSLDDKIHKLTLLRFV